MVQGGFERGRADAVGVEQFRGVVHHDLLGAMEFGQGFLVPQCVYERVGDPLLPGPSGVGEPDVLAVFGPRGHDHDHLLDVLGQFRLLPEVKDQVVGPFSHLGTVDHH